MCTVRRLQGDWCAPATPSAALYQPLPPGAACEGITPGAAPFRRRVSASPLSAAQILHRVPRLLALTPDHRRSCGVNNCLLLLKTVKTNEQGNISQKLKTHFPKVVPDMVFKDISISSQCSGSMSEIRFPRCRILTHCRLLQRCSVAAKR